jgi:selenocysteine-specific elongation factor
MSDTESTASAVLAMIDEAGLRGLPAAQLIGRAGVRWAERDRLVAQLDGRAMRIGNALISTSHLAEATEAILTVVGRYHVSHPLEDGIPREELREQVFGPASPGVFEEVLRALVDRGRIVARDRVALASHSVALNDEEARTRDAIVQILREAGLTPPDIAVLADQIGVTAAVVDRILNLLVRQKVLVRSGDLLFHETALARLKIDVQSLKHSDAAGTLDVAAFKDLCKVTRKYAIPLLEYLDRERITRRVGGSRQIL